MHVVRDCAIAVDIWKHLLSNQERGKFFLVEFHEWINLNLTNKFDKGMGMIGRQYGLLLAIYCGSGITKACMMMIL
jgi:hypothetical protein